MAVISGKRNDPYRNFKFRVKIPGFQHLGFQKVSGLKEETTVTEYREGGDLATPRKLPAQSKFDNIVFERGMSTSTDFKSWRAELFNPDGAPIFLDDDIRRTVTIELLDRTGVLVKAWEVYSAWPCIMEIGDLDAGSDDVLIEKLELTNEGHIQIV